MFYSHQSNHNEETEFEERNYWTKEEVKKFLAIIKREISLRDHVLFHLLIYTGDRKGELLAITWDDIDFDGGSIRFIKTLFHNNDEFILQTSKTKESKRLISLDTRSFPYSKNGVYGK